MRFFNYLFRGVVLWIYILILLKIASYPIEFIFQHNPYGIIYVQVWMSLIKEITNFEFFNLKSWGREFLYLSFIGLHYLIIKQRIIIFNFFKPYIIFFPKKIFSLIDKLFPIK